MKHEESWGRGYYLGRRDVRKEGGTVPCSHGLGLGRHQEGGVISPRLGLGYHPDGCHGGADSRLSGCRQR